MTINTTPPPADEDSAADRLRAYLAGYKRLRSLDQAVIHSIGIDGEVIALSVSDIEAVIHQADSLRHYAPFTHRNIEAQHNPALDNLDYTD